MLRLVSKRNASSLVSTPRSQNPNHFRYSPSIQNRDLKTPHFNVVDYLINSCGLSPDSAARISKPISHLRSSENPDAVLCLLKQQGFAEAEINKLITWQPSLLCCPQKSLDSNLSALRHIGISNAALNQIILSGPAALQLRSAVPRIMFWRDFLQGDDAALVKIFKSTLSLVGRDISLSITPKLSFLQTQGLSTQDVRRILLNVSHFITRSAPTMEDLLKRTKELGFQPGSKMFVHGLNVMTHVSPEFLQRKMELLKTFGWTDDEFLSAVQKAPSVAWKTELGEEVEATPPHLTSSRIKGYTKQKEEPLYCYDIFRH